MLIAWFSIINVREIKKINIMVVAPRTGNPVFSEQFISRAKALLAKRNKKSLGDKNDHKL